MSGERPYLRKEERISWIELLVFQIHQNKHLLERKRKKMCSQRAIV